MLFSSYFDQWLYGEGGYYRKALEIGKEGDFYTSVSASRFFGGAIANHIYRQIKERALTDAAIIEIGAHRGYLMADMIQFLYTFDPKLLEMVEFGIVEPLEEMQKIQQAYLRESFGDALYLRFFGDVSEIAGEKPCFFVANELFDALPCELLHNGRFAGYVDGKVEFTGHSKAGAAMAERFGLHKGEVPVGYAPLIEGFSHIERFEFITFDYGDMRARGDFSIRVYKEHTTLPFFEIEELSEYFQKSDLTYDVHFGIVKALFEDIGAELVEFSNQNSALVSFGIESLLQMMLEHAPERAYLQEANRVKTLLDPHFLGERFKMARTIKGEF